MDTRDAAVRLPRRGSRRFERVYVYSHSFDNALALLSEEELAACQAPCPGHLGPKALAKIREAREGWESLAAERNRLRALVAMQRHHINELFAWGMNHGIADFPGPGLRVRGIAESGPDQAEAWLEGQRAEERERCAAVVEAEAAECLRVSLGTTSREVSRINRAGRVRALEKLAARIRASGR